MLAFGDSVCIFCAETNHHRLKRTHSCYSLTGAVVPLDLGVGSALSPGFDWGGGASKLAHVSRVHFSVVIEGGPHLLWAPRVPVTWAPPQAVPTWHFCKASRRE